MVDVKFITKSGLKSAKKAARHEIEGFLESVYFKEKVLKKYESNKDFSVGDHGTVLFKDKWGLYRGVYRVAKGYIAANLGDLGEGLPDKELEYWKQYNIPPSQIPIGERYFDFRDTIHRMIYFMEQSNKRVENHIKKFYFDVKLRKIQLFDLTYMEDTLNHIKKVIDKKTTVDEFQVRIIFLNILLLESINTDLIKKIFTTINEDLCYSNEKLALKEISKKYLLNTTPQQLKKNLKNSIEPLKSLRLLQKFLLLLKVHHDIITTLKIKQITDLKKRKKDIYNKISDEFVHFYNYKIYGTSFRNKDYFLQNEKIIEEDTKILRLLNKFRNASAAHGFNEKEYKEILKQLGFKRAIKDYSVIYEQLISRVSYDVEHIYFKLITPDPPILDYYKIYLKESLKELENNSRSYQSTFEELASYLYDFPELYDELITEVIKIYSSKKNDQCFIVEFGCFIESISYSVKEKTQDLINYIIEGYQYNKPLTVAHIHHILDNSTQLTDSFYDKLYPFILIALKEDDVNVSYCAQPIIFLLIERFPERLNKEEIKEILKNRTIYHHLLNEWLQH